jgi:hypothetical protein
VLGRDRPVEVGLLEPEQVLTPGEVVAGVLAGVDLRQRAQGEAGRDGSDAREDQKGGP